MLTLTIGNNFFFNASSWGNPLENHEEWQEHLRNASDSASAAVASGGGREECSDCSAQGLAGLSLALDASEVCAFPAFECV